MVRFAGQALVCLLAVATLACNSSSPAQPNNPPATTPPPSGPIVYNIAVSVDATDGSGGIAQAVLEILDGMFAGQTFTAGDDGRITLTGAQGNMNIEARATGFRSQRKGIGPPATSGATQTLAFMLEPVPAPAPPPPTPGISVSMCLDLDDEELHITNNSSTPLDLDDWTIRDNDDLHTYRFFNDVDGSCRPSVDEFLVAPGAKLVVTSGDSPVTSPPTHLAGWCNHVWNNLPTGDMARLFDDAGALIATATGANTACQ